MKIVMLTWIKSLQPAFLPYLGQLGKHVKIMHGHATVKRVPFESETTWL